MMGEVWRDIPDYEGLYQVSNLGNVRNARGRILSPSNWNGYQRVNLCKSGRYTTVAVHRLVLLAFTEESSWGEEVNHLNFDRADNRLENLEWLSHAGNIRYSIPNRPKHTPHSVFSPSKNHRRVRQMTKTGALVKVWDNLSTIHRELGFEQTPIKCCCEQTRHYNTAYGFKWQYAD